MIWLTIVLCIILCVSAYQALNDPAKMPSEEVPDDAIVEWEDVGDEPW